MTTRAQRRRRAPADSPIDAPPTGSRCRPAPSRSSSPRPSPRSTSPPPRACGARCSASSRTGRSTAPRPGSTTTCSRRSPTSRSARTARATSRSGTRDGTLTTGWGGWTSSGMTPRDQLGPRQRHPRGPDRHRVRVDDEPGARPEGAPRQQRGAHEPRPPDRRPPCGTAARTASTSTSSRSRVGLRRRVRVAAPQGPAPSSTGSGPATSSRTTRPATSATTRWRRRWAPAPPTRSSSWATTTGSASSSTAGSIDPLSGPRYDLTDTVRAYTARVARSRLILGLPWYGRAWSTTTDDVRARGR